MMTDVEMLNRLKSLSGETNEDTLLAFLDLAATKVLNRVYPYRSDKREVPVKYHSNQLEIALYLLNKRGAEGETSHSENGISRSYESASVPESMYKGIVPHASVIGYWDEEV